MKIKGYLHNQIRKKYIKWQRSDQIIKKFNNVTKKLSHKR